MTNWQIQTVEISKLKEHPYNPRHINKKQLAHLETLIKKYGLIDKPIVNTDFTIIGGHQRIKILKKMKCKTVECWVPDRLLSQEDINHLCIGLNLNQGDWDFDILANAWDVKELVDWGFEENTLLGLSEDSMPSIIDEEPEKPISAPGDVYELGPHRFTCGDSQAEMLFCDQTVKQYAKYMKKLRRKPMITRNGQKFSI